MARPHTPTAPLAQCRAKNRAGNPCGGRVIRGGTVCRMHGGSAPQVKKSARERLDDMIDPALNRLLRLIDDESSGIALAAVKDILDRGGYKAIDRQQISGPDGGPIQTEEVGIDDADRVTRILAILERAGKRAGGPADGAESDLAAITRPTNGSVALGR